MVTSEHAFEETSCIQIITKGVNEEREAELSVKSEDEFVPIAMVRGRRANASVAQVEGNGLFWVEEVGGHCEHAPAALDVQ